MLSQSSTRDEVKPLTLALSWFRRLARGAFATYFTLDPRSLGLCRLGLGALLLYDLLRRVPGLSTWYSNQGLVPNHASLLRRGATYMFSFLFAASRAEEAAVMFAICGFVFLVFTVGYRTRLFHALSLACTVSLHSRCVFLENGGDVVLNLLCAWTLFLPMELASRSMPFEMTFARGAKRRLPKRGPLLRSQCSRSSCSSRSSIT
jgi:hypothetical protein